jgi:antibiotic biosynthesis monooxygenase (ABM) superfamily enzyme
MLTTVTSLISRHGHEQSVVEDFERAFAKAGQDSHHLGTLLIQQSGGLNFLISQFADQSELDKWMSSSTHQEMVRAFEQDSLRQLCVIGEPIVRVAVPSDGSGPKWKVFASTWVVVYPLLLLLSLTLDLVYPGLPLPVRLAVTSSVLSVASIWLINPVTHALTRVWRLRNQQMRIEVTRYPSTAVQKP